ncbi:MAG: hypothetical protein JWM62_2968, partial [Frankiales bacterium]|nr:hypothetical protein [Frankiales bacterium]
LRQRHDLGALSHGVCHGLGSQRQVRVHITQHGLQLDGGDPADGDCWAAHRLTLTPPV